MSEAEDFEVLPCMPLEYIKVEKPETTADRSLPSKSTSVYEASYRRFMKWCDEKNINEYPEEVLLKYFTEMATKMNSSTMWSHYSMIRSLLNIKQNVDISKYIKLRNYLKKQAKGYKPKKARSLTQDQYNKFLAEAPDNKYLAIKVILIFGISGGCTCSELVNLQTEDIEDHGSILLIKILDSKTNKTRTFTVLGDEYLAIYRNYASRRPPGFNERFFLKYQNGVCHRMVMGIHTIGGIAKEVASYLKLPNWKEYTGHCLRRTSATLRVDKGTDITSLKREIEESLSKKEDFAMKIVYPNSRTSDESSSDQSTFDESSSEIAGGASNYTSQSTSEIINEVINTDISNAISSVFQNANFKNCTFNFNFVNK